MREGHGAPFVAAQWISIVSPTSLKSRWMLRRQDKVTRCQLATGKTHEKGCRQQKMFLCEPETQSRMREVAMPSPHCQLVPDHRQRRRWLGSREWVAAPGAQSSLGHQGRPAPTELGPAQGTWALLPGQHSCTAIILVLCFCSPPQSLVHIAGAT